MGKNYGCCCNEGSCDIAQDNFNRSNSTNLGSGWTAATRDNFSIVGNQAVADNTDAAIFDTLHPDPDPSGIAIIKTIDEVFNSGDTYRVICNAVNENNYHWCDFTRNAGDTSVLAIGKRTGGVDTTIKSLPIVGLSNLSRDLQVRIAPGELCGMVSNAVLSFVGKDATPFPTGYRIGMKASVAGLKFDDLRFVQHNETFETCPVCICKCDTKYIPPVLNARFQGFGPRMEALSCDAGLVYDRADNTWKGDACGCFTGRVRWNCPSVGNDPLTAILTLLDSGCTNSDGFHGGARLPSTATCDPINILYGPYTVAGSDLSCGCGPVFTAGSYTVTITA
jgi:hypothetical protein